MKILPVDKVREADAYTIEHEPIASTDLMERAATACYEWLRLSLPTDKKIIVFCGMGNNGGDGLAISRMLVETGYQVETVVVRFSSKGSGDFGINYDRLSGIEGARIVDIDKASILPRISSEDVVIDALFGSGLTRPAGGFPAEVINHINKSAAMVVAVDIPSGLFSDQHISEKEGAIINADYTLSFQFTKLAFKFTQNERFVGDWRVRSIGRSQDLKE